MLESSLTHWPGRVAAVVFLGGCTLRCPRCPSPHLISRRAEGGTIPLEAVLDSIYRRRRWIEGVVLKGGEPLSHPETRELLDLLTEFGLATRMDTPGTRPGVLRRLLEDELLDYVALELKGPLDERYGTITGNGVDLEAIYESIEILLSGRVSHEFRLAVDPDHHTEEDVLKLARTLRGGRRLVIRPVRGRVGDRSSAGRFGPGRTRLRALARRAEAWVAECRVDGRIAEADRARPVPEGSKERKGA